MAESLNYNIVLEQQLWSTEEAMKSLDSKWNPRPFRALRSTEREREKERGLKPRLAKENVSNMHHWQCPNCALGSIGRNCYWIDPGCAMLVAPKMVALPCSVAFLWLACRKEQASGENNKGKVLLSSSSTH